MKYVSITFDDGREDNYLEAFPIMRENSLTGTIFCTTGFIDKSWIKPIDWYSADNPIGISQLKEMKDSGWEVALHGDKHTTEVEDLSVAFSKMDEWGLASRTMGFSMPNSNIAKEKLDSVIDTMLGSKIDYIRTGRRINTKNVGYRILYALYSLGKFQWAYNLFNANNINDIRHISPEQIFSIVIRCNDTPKMVYRFIESAPDDSWIVLMFHSIVSEKNPVYGIDPWNWSNNKFVELCSKLHALETRGIVKVKNMQEIVEEYK